MRFHSLTAALALLGAGIAEAKCTYDAFFQAFATNAVVASSYCSDVYIPSQTVTVKSTTTQSLTTTVRTSTSLSTTTAFSTSTRSRTSRGTSTVTTTVTASPPAIKKRQQAPFPPFVLAIASVQVSSACSCLLGTVTATETSIRTIPTIIRVTASTQDTRVISRTTIVTETELATTTTVSTTTTLSRSTTTTSTTSSSTTSTSSSTTSTSSYTGHPACADPTVLPAYEKFTVLMPQPGQTNADGLGSNNALYSGVLPTTYSECCEACCSSSSTSCVGFEWIASSKQCFTQTVYGQGKDSPNPNPVPATTCASGSFYVALEGTPVRHNYRAGPCMIPGNPVTVAPAAPAPNVNPYYPTCGDPQYTRNYTDIAFWQPQPNDATVGKASFGSSTRYINNYQDCCASCYSNNYVSCLGYAWDPVYRECTIWSSSGRGVANPNPSPYGSCYSGSYYVALTGQGGGNIHMGSCAMNNPPPAVGPPTSVTPGCPAAPTSTNIVNNGDFENQDAWTSCWALNSQGSTGYDTSFSAGGIRHSGFASGKVVAANVPANKQVLFSLDTTLAATNNQAYTCSAWYYISQYPTPTCTLTAILFGSQQRNIAVTGYSSWQQGTFTFIGANVPATLQLQFSCTSTSYGYYNFYVDDVSCIATA